MISSKTFFEVIRFVIVGGINTVNYYIVYLILLKLLHVHYLISHITGFIVALFISYFLSCYFVYHVKPTLKKFLAFPLTQVVNMSVQFVLLYIFVEFLHIDDTLAPFAGLVVTIPITYLLSKFILKDR
ncbi:GtrA family protein [Staphylococcus canis]|uniref:GtrA family protein n=1 Tax=Staphylococcus canis TaxID=2724942 RepID=A0ABS0T822_9STAP|nr:GtrA family protein [Staphylococcus canis]MBI5974883.1 GtrA family protein [Staphylococcus canis]